MRKKTWVVIGIAIVVLAGGLIAAKRSGDGKGEPKEPPFRLGKVDAEDLQVAVRDVGVVDPVDKVEVKSAVSGRVLALDVREGDVVKKGDVLAEVEPDVTQAQSLSEVISSVSQAELKLRDAERSLAAQQKLFDAGLIGQENLRDYQVARDLAAQDLDAAKTRYRIVEDHGIPISSAGGQRARVLSPMDGVVISRGVELGETVTSGVSSFNAGTVLFTVADLQSLEIKVNLNEVDIAKVHVGQPVRISLDAYPQREFTGKVRFVAPAATLEDKIKVFKTEIALDQLDPAFRTGMSTNVEILGERRDRALSIPLEALQRKDGQVIAYRLKANLDPKALDKARTELNGKNKYTWLSENWQQYFEPVPIDAGIATLERVEVVSGLAAGDQVALEDPSRKKVERDDDVD
jgi:RND family efflux transporter MFP subunit